jgi:diguanylate cyclase (GGDEF)-like protein
MSDLIVLQNENQNLKEIIELAKQISSGLDIGQIVKNVNMILYTKYQASCSAFIIQKDIDDLKPVYHLYRGSSRDNFEAAFDSLIPLIEFFENEEYNQIYFSQFCESFNNKSIVEEFKRLDPEFLIPLRADKGIVGLYVQGKKKTNVKYTTDDIQFCVNIIGFASIALENANLYRQATVDRMTKLYTHHQFQKRLEEEIKKGHRFDNKFSLIMFDIDHFKKINDQHGHLQGDIVIKEVAKIFSDSIRDIDFASRYGGDEFIAILPQVDSKTAARVADRVRKAVEKFEFQTENDTLSVTLSIGVIDFNPAFVYYNENIIEAVDAALYHSKQNGRNHVSIGRYNLEAEIFS